MKLHPPRFDEIQAKACVSYSTRRRHFYGERFNLATCLATQNLCDSARKANLADMLVELENGVTDSMVNSLLDVESPEYNVLYRQYCKFFLGLLATMQDEGFSTSYVHFDTDDSLGWHMGIICNNVYIRVVAHTREEGEIWIGGLQFRATIDNLIVILNAHLGKN